MVAETTLSDVANVGVALYDPHAVIVVSVIDASGGNHSAHVIDKSMQR